MSIRLFIAISLVLCVPGASAPAGTLPETTYRSGPDRVALVELYTSEGCSSCPPADRWLSNLEKRPGLWQDFVPVAFHVDYWNYLGWRDRFAMPEYSDRQRRHADEGNVGTVYTPAFVVGGREWWRWRAADAPPVREARAGVLSATLGDTAIAVRYAPDSNRDGPLMAHVALLGFDLDSDVARGENAGRRLRHDFVVLATTSTRMNEDGDDAVARLAYPEAAMASKRLALAVWVTPADTLEPLQATGGWLACRVGPTRAIVSAPDSPCKPVRNSP